MNLRNRRGGKGLGTGPLGNHHEDQPEQMCSGMGGATSGMITTHGKGTGQRKAEQQQAPKNDFAVNQTEGSQTGPAKIHQQDYQATTKREKWSAEEYKEIMWCYFYVKEITGTSNIKENYEVWRTRNPNTRPNITANTLASQRRYIMQNNKIPEAELDKIKEKVKNECEESDQPPTASKIGTEDPIPYSSNRRERNTERTITTEQERTIEELVVAINEEKVKYENLQRHKLPKIKKNAHTTKTMKNINEALNQILKASKTNLNITQINTLTYAAGSVAVKQMGIKTKVQQQQKREKPRWKTRIEQNIAAMRKELSQITEISKGNKSSRMEYARERLFTKYNIKSKDNMIQLIETLKQKIQAKAQRLRRYTERYLFFTQNKQFNEDPKRYYRNMRGTQIEVNSPPEKSIIKEFWKGIWDKSSEHNERSGWISREEKRTRRVTEMPWKEITIEDVKNTLNKAANWKAPGPDGLQNYWLKNFPVTHEPLAAEYNKMLDDPGKIPDWLIKGTTHLLPKNKKTEEAKNYRPITCLPTIYKNLTAIISDRIYHHLEKNNLFPNEQKGCKRNSYGCKDQLLTNNLITEDAKNRKKRLSMGWVDYQKAFDSVPHSWLLKILELNRISRPITSFLEKAMSKWKTELLLNTTNGTMNIGTVNIRRGIFQGDSLSPLLFCMALFPLSKELNESNKGYHLDESQTPINHLFYVDDLKLYAKNEEELEHLLKIVKIFSDDIDMKFGLEKCAKVTIERGKAKKTQNIQLDQDTEIKTVDGNQIYKYLGIEENAIVEHDIMKEKIAKEYYVRVRNILKSQLNCKNKFIAIASLAQPVLAYSFGVVNWKESEIEAVDRKTRKLLTMYNLHHPKADVDRLYLPRKRGGRGLVKIHDSFKLSLIGLAQYIRKKKNDRLINMIKTHRSKGKTNKMVMEKGSEYTKTYLQEEELTAVDNEQETTTKAIKKIKEECKKKMNNSTEERWLAKAMHGQYGREMKNASVNRELSFKWLCTGVLKGETEAFIVAAQDQAITTNYIRQKIHKERVNPECRLCKQFDETIKHIMTGCPVLAKKEYIQRHNKVCTCLHFNICKDYGIETTAANWYTHNPKSVQTNGDIVVIWDTQVNTDRTISANKPDIIIKDPANKRCYLIDVAIPSDATVNEKEAEKRLKYKDLQIEIQRMWGLKTTILPVVIGATGTISKHLPELVKAIPGNDSKQIIYIIQQTALMETAHIIRRAL